MQLDRVAREVVLESLKRALPTQWPARVQELREMVAAGLEPTLRIFLNESGLEISDVYANDKSWSDLREAAGLHNLPAGPNEPVLRRALGRLLHVDDAERINAYRSLLDRETWPDYASLDERTRRYARMLAAQLGDQVFSRSHSAESAWPLLWQHAQVRAEAAELMELLAERVDHLHPVLDSHPNVPLFVHGRYTRIEILAAFDDGTSAKVAAWQTGVRHLQEHHADLLAFTLDKSSSGFSPTTRYRDYAISRELIHWESQGIVRADSETGLRYQQHARRNHEILLFARLSNDERAFWFLGPATYVDHHGEKPMAITWRLRHALPGDLFAQFAAAVA